MQLRALRGFIFDLDGTIWAGAHLLPGAIELVQTLRDAGRPVLFLSNSSRQGADELAVRLRGLQIPAEPDQIVSALELAGEVIRRDLGRVPVLPLGSATMTTVLRDAGHTVLGLEEYPRARAVVIGNDPAFDFGRLRAAARAVAAGAGFYAVNLDARLPLGAEGFDPGCGALVEAVAVASGRRATVIGKPYRPIFELALARLGCQAAEVAMVGDTPESDIDGGRAAGMPTIWITPDGRPDPAVPASLVVRDPADLLDRWHACA